MKARKNDKIVCGCADSAGHIRNDLKDADTITSDDLAIAVDMERELNNEPTPYDLEVGGFRHLYCSRKLKAHIILYDVSGRTKEGRRLRRIVRLAMKFERDRASAVSASGYHEAFHALLDVHIELQDHFAKAALATKPLTMRGLDIYAAIIVACNGSASYNGRPVGYCEPLGLAMAEAFIAVTANGPSQGKRA